MTDVLRWPVVGAVLRWRHLRTTTQVVLGLVALALVLDGLFGPQFAPTNLATLGTWIHYRGLLIGVLLFAGNAFCHACPMIKARDLARRVHAPRLRWPRALRSKWLAIPLFAGVLFAYELFDLWALPAATAWLILGYFGGGDARRHALHRGDVLPARLPGRPVQLHRVHAVAPGDSRQGPRRLRELQDGGLPQRPSQSDHPGMVPIVNPGGPSRDD